MLTHQTNAVLKGVRKYASSSGDVFNFLWNTTYICLQSDIDKVYDYSKYEKEIYQIIDYLDSEGYVKIIHNHSFTITYRGFHPYQMSLKKLINFLFRSIVTPIFVSAITAILTIYISKLL